MHERDKMLPQYGRVAQWQSSGLLSHWLSVRVAPRSQQIPLIVGVFLFFKPDVGVCGYLRVEF